MIGIGRNKYRQNLRYFDVGEDRKGKVIRYLDYQPPKLRRLYKIGFILVSLISVIVGVVFTIFIKNFSNDANEKQLFLIMIWVVVGVVLIIIFVNYLIWKWKYDDNVNDS